MNTVPTPEQRAAAAAMTAPQPVALDLRNTWLVLAALLLPLLPQLETALSIARIWENSGTFAHGFVILPISIWLVWRQRAALQTLPVAPCWPALAALAACGAAWLLADLVSVGVVRQYALAWMLPLTVLALLGRRIAQALLFPLAFVLFAVPVGEALIPSLIDLTADFTVDALRLTGIPVLRDGNNFSIPSGNWSVVEACSGLRYLISSVTLGCLFAYLSFRSARRRALFVLASLVVPIAANAVRAYMIVMIGHLSDMTLAVGVDHLIYGWVFFGIVMLLLFWVGSFWREDHDTPDALRPAGPSLPLPRRQLGAALLAVLVLLAAFPAYAAWLDRQQDAAPPVELGNWQPAAPAGPAFTEWQPDFAPATAVARQFFAGQPPLGLEVRYYRDTPDGGKLVSATNVMGRDLSAYRSNSVEARTEQLAGGAFAVREAMLGNEGRRLLVWQWYWVGGQATANDYAGKLLQARQKVLSGNGDGAAIMLFSPYEEDPAPARAAMRAFLEQNMAPLGAMLEKNKRP